MNPERIIVKLLVAMAWTMFYQLRDNETRTRIGNAIKEAEDWLKVKP